MISETLELIHSGGNGLDWLWYLAGNSQMAPTIFFDFFNYLIKNPQTTIALTFLTHNISDIGGVLYVCSCGLNIYF